MALGETASSHAVGVSAQPSWCGTGVEWRACSWSRTFFGSALAGAGLRARRVCRLVASPAGDETPSGWRFHSLRVVSLCLQSDSKLTTRAVSCQRLRGKGTACGNSCIARNQTCPVGRDDACSSWKFVLGNGIVNLAGKEFSIAVRTSLYLVRERPFAIFAMSKANLGTLESASV